MRRGIWWLCFGILTALCLNASLHVLIYLGALDRHIAELSTAVSQFPAKPVGELKEAPNSDPLFLSSSQQLLFGWT